MHHAHFDIRTGGAAGIAAAEMLRRRGYDGTLTMLSADADAPVDRPNLSKDFLAGNAADDWMPLRPAGAKSALVIGASFIGLEGAASLRARGIEAHAVAPDAVPVQRVPGPELGRLVQALHVSLGVRFHLGPTAQRLDGPRVTLVDGTGFDADVVVADVGAQPSLALAEQAGLAIDRGVLVVEMLQTSVPGIYAAGDIARWPDPHTGRRIRVEQWVVAQRQGQVAALNMRGQRQRFDDVPFFRSQHCDVAIQYAGHAERWDVLQIDGSIEARDFAVRCGADGWTLALVTIGRDLENLCGEFEMEQSDIDDESDQALSMTLPAGVPVAVDPPRGAEVQPKVNE